MPHSRALRVGVDIGGTFTDIAILDDSGTVAVGKALTPPQEPAAAVEDLLRHTFESYRLDPGDITTIVHGTTLVTNALIERRGARTALVTTDGFRDVVEMAREHRYELYDLGLELPRPLVPRHLRFGVRERILADGTVETALDEATVEQLAVELSAAGVEAAAVCFLHSHTNPHHERQVQKIFAAAAPRLRVALSSDINPEIREYERASTTLANVYVQGLVENYLEDLRYRLRNLNIGRDPLIMLSNGGVAAINVATRFPVKMLESGPAGGALGAVAFGRNARRPNQLAFDMGGTTAKLCIIEANRPRVTHTFEVDRVYRLRAGSGLPVRAPVIDMIEIGTGGGSIAKVNSLGLITVGPESAGSEPGPVSYGRGGVRCTVTDADLVLGYLDPNGFIDSGLNLDPTAAATAIKEQVADKLGISVAEAAWGIHTTANENMANAARVHAIERGQDPGRLPLFVSGGNGPLHGPGIARALGSPSLSAPPAAGVLSALGFLSAPMSIDITRSWHTSVANIELRAARETIDEMECEGADLLTVSGVMASAITFERTLEMRFVGQGNEIEVPVPKVGDDWQDAIVASFAEQYAYRFGNVMPTGVEVEILTWRVTARGPDPQAQLRFESTEEVRKADLGQRKAYFPKAGSYVTTAVYDRYHLAQGAVVDGPALVQERESTLVLAPGMRGTVTEDTCIRVEFTEGL